MQRRFHTHRPQGDTFPSELFEPFEPSEPGPQRGPIVISRVGSGVEKSPGTMLLVASGKYVSRHTASLTSDRLKSDVSNLKNKTRNHVYKLNPR